MFRLGFGHVGSFEEAEASFGGHEAGRPLLIRVQPSKGDSDREDVRLLLIRRLVLARSPTRLPWVEATCLVACDTSADEGLVIVRVLPVFECGVVVPVTIPGRCFDSLVGLAAVLAKNRCFFRNSTIIAFSMFMTVVKLW
jgi:hypothetical protein